jgi:hypothetical protein
MSSKSTQGVSNSGTFKRFKCSHKGIDGVRVAAKSNQKSENFNKALRKGFYSTLISQLLFRWTEKKYIEASNAGTASKNPNSGRTVTPLNRKPAVMKRKNNPIPAFDIRSTMHIFFIGSPH